MTNNCFTSEISDVNSSSSSDLAKLTHAVNQQTSVVTTVITAILKQFQAIPPPASVKAVEEIFAGNYNQGNSGYCPPGVTNQTRPLGLAQPNVQNNQNRFSQPQGYNRGNNFNQNANYQAPIQQNQSVPLSELEKIKKMNDVNIKSMQAQINNVKNELRNEMQTSIQASMSNQTNELKNMMASFFQMNTASTLGTGSLPSNTVANPKGELKAITTRDAPEHSEFTIKVPPPLIQKAKPPSQRNYVVHQRDPRHPHIPYPSRMNQEKQKEKDEVQIHKFWQMFKQLHINIILADALILILKYQKMLKSLLSNKEKLLELANTPLNENCSAVILKKLPEKLGDPGKFLIFELIPSLIAESNLRGNRVLLNHDPIKEMDYILEDSIDKNSPDDNLVDTISEMIFSEVDALPLTDNEDKVFNPGILIHENHFEVTNCATMEKNVKNIFSSNGSLILEDLDPPLSL
ncbi:hypothetical protein Tco_0073038 [Tanacetum coccineum]